MKLQNKALLWLSLSLFFIIGLWSLAFYFSMFSEIKDSVDEGLENYKRQIIFDAENDSTLLSNTNFNDGFFSIHEISKNQALSMRDTYCDTMLYMQDADDVVPELEPVRFLTTACELNGKFYKLNIVNSMIEESDLIQELVINSIWLYIILMLALIFINNIVLKQLWTPFYSYLKQLKTFRIDDEKPLPAIQTNIQEFIDLKHAITQLLTQTSSVFNQQKQFIGNAAHELQTPLAIVMNKLELLIENGELTEKQAEEIGNVMQLIERLTRLNKSLLLLAKIENKQFTNEEQLSWNELIKQTINDFEELVLYRQLTVEIIEHASLESKINPTLAGIIISNIYRNAIFHNYTSGKILVEINRNSVCVKNTGNEEALNEMQIFERFYKSNANSSSSGLGLAIVKAICSIYGYSVNYSYQNDMHCFEIIFLN